MRAALAVCSILVLSQLVAAAEQDILDLFNNVQNSPRVASQRLFALVTRMRKLNLGSGNLVCAGRSYCL